MIIWLIAFLLIIIVSFLLALRSMKDFQEVEVSEKTGVFLIKNHSAINQFLVGLSTMPEATVSLEKLFKGSKAAYVVYGDKEILNKFPDLDLLELEDYSKQVFAKQDLPFSAWEMGTKDETNMHRKLAEEHPLFNGVLMQDTEQLWWQIVLHSEKEGFKSTIRAVLICELDRKAKLSANLQKNEFGLVKVPRPITAKDYLKAYQHRSPSPVQLLLSASEVLKLI